MTGAATVPQPDPDAMVHVQGFSAWFGLTAALRDITLRIPPRQVTACIGPSGSGKSTLLRAINRLNDLRPGYLQQGQLWLQGDDLTGPAVDIAALRQRVGMVFQQSNPFPRSIFENVAYGPRLQGVRDRALLADTVEACLRRAALWDEVRDRLRESAFTLSVGQQQRLCIARALANGPDVLLLDEPTSALDPTATQRIEELLYELRSDLTILLVTHNLHQAARVSDRTVLLDEGRVVEFGETRQLFTAPRDPRTEAFITGRFG